MTMDPYGYLLDRRFLDMGFVHAMAGSLSIILVSEIGDKTFFIVAIMAMRHPRLAVYSGAMAAMTLMTLMSVYVLLCVTMVTALLGFATTVVPRWLTYYLTSCIVAVFGIKMLVDGSRLTREAVTAEMAEANGDIRRSNEQITSRCAGPSGGGGARRGAGLWRVFAQSFSLTFLAEWGDRSQVSTILLAARDNMLGVVVGGLAAHALCSGEAVMGGQLMASRVSLRTVYLVGGIFFLIFSLSPLVFDPDD